MNSVLNKVVAQVTAEVNNDFKTRAKRKNALTLKARKGLVPVAIYTGNYGSKRFQAQVFDRDFGFWEHEGRVATGYCILKRGDIRFDDTGEVARKLWEFQKERNKIAHAEQRYLKSAFILGKLDTPPLKVRP